ncbi:BnaC02g40280D [Brassica napus]|uniref:(rape) hypothetical protein n=1 Tax=Brassica napus TaxID=3708 RepID=A0A078GEP4_BRANA|nr:unnamed protein product [Brassica napus]CDY24980.1 BnaC02g40280D [Brassica napus]
MTLKYLENKGITSKSEAESYVLLQSKVDFQHSPLPCDPSTRPIRQRFSEFAKLVSSKGFYA